MLLRVVFRQKGKLLLFLKGFCLKERASEFEVSGGRSHMRLSSLEFSDVRRDLQRVHNERSLNCIEIDCGGSFRSQTTSVPLQEFSF